MKIDFSNPPPSVRNAAISPVRSALEAIRLANEANTVTKSKVSKALAGVQYRQTEKTIELYAPAPSAKLLTHLLLHLLIQVQLLTIQNQQATYWLHFGGNLTRKPSRLFFIFR